jgi:ABC-type multidrug transport system ATPase subunit
MICQVSGQLCAGKVTAIMGPSGSGTCSFHTHTLSLSLTLSALSLPHQLIGKTTLLKLLGGQMFSGEFNGLRAINNIIPKKDVYDQVSQ